MRTRANSRTRTRKKRWLKIKVRVQVSKLHFEALITTSKLTIVPTCSYENVQANARSQDDDNLRTHDAESSDSDHSTTSQDDYDSQDSFIASDDDNGKIDSDESYGPGVEQEESEKEWSARDEDDNDEVSINESFDDTCASSDRNDIDVNPEDTGNAMRRSRRISKGKRPTYKEDGSACAMSDDFDSDDYDEEAFGSDNDEGASIRTSESENGTRYEEVAGGRKKVKRHSAKSNKTAANLFGAQADGQDNAGDNRAAGEHSNNDKNDTASVKRTENYACAERSGGGKSGVEQDDRCTKNSNNVVGTAIIGARDVSQCTKQVTINDCRAFYETDK